MSGTAIFKAEVRRAGALSRQAKAGSRKLRAVISADFRGQLGPDILEAMKEAAPYDEEERDDIHLRDELEVKTRGLEATVHSPVVSSEGFPYTDVTRFGRGAIVPRTAPVLRWESRGVVHVAKRVAAWKPAGGDWVVRGRRSADADVRSGANRIGREIRRVVM